ncbi:MAG: SEC-C domain-containing protein [Chloroflexi bacterium]|nr:SEC-C domain-containing protein [Chloroflexota bacterium]MBU1747452.1 SEC-C domain-containing protein [Chloroflexota bacterium]
MYLIPFYVIDPELAARETRVMHTLVRQDGLPLGSYGLLEFYCPDPACDCRRVMFNVAEEKQPDRFLASISYGFDRDAPEAGPYLDPLNPQSPHAATLLRLVETTVLNDPRYTARLERHYALVKKAASDSRHPAYRQVRQVLRDEARDLPRSPRRRVRRNDPCPCGSGKPYRRCCMRQDRP